MENSQNVNILIPASGNNQAFAKEYWPQNVVEVNGRTMLQYAIENFAPISNKSYTIILKKEECLKFHTNSMVQLFTSSKVQTLQVEKETQGALCSCLMAVQQINNGDELIISNNDQKFDCDIKAIIEDFRNRKADAGVVTFECVHPRWSYVRMDNNEVVEVAEKMPISKSAIAGLYYFKKGSDFVKAAKSAILKGKDVNGKYYISAAVNEMILMNKRILNFEINAKDYHTFYEKKLIEQYEEEMRRK